MRRECLWWCLASWLAEGDGPAHTFTLNQCIASINTNCAALPCLWLQGVPPSDQMHDMLISLCTQEQRLEEAVDLVKRLARRPPGASSAHLSTQQQGQQASPPGSPRAGAGAGGGGSSGAPTTSGGLQEHTLNSLIRALCGKYVDRALRLLSLCQVRWRWCSRCLPAVQTKGNPHCWCWRALWRPGGECFRCTFFTAPPAAQEGHLPPARPPPPACLPYLPTAHIHPPSLSCSI